MSGLSVLLEGFDAGKHPRDWRGRWIGGTLHVFHGATKITEVHAVGPNQGGREEMLRRVRHAVGARAGRPEISRVQAQQVVDLASGTPPAEPSPTYRGQGETPLVTHGGFKVGDVVKYSTGRRGAMTPQPGLHAVVGLQRNGNLRVKHPVNGTTVDVPHQDATKIGPLHPDYRGQAVQDAIKAQRGVVAAGRAARARPAGGASRANPLDEMVNFGGIPTRKGDVIRTLQQQGHPQVYIDRYMQGLERGRKLQASAPASALGSLLEGFAPAVVGPPASWAGRFDVKDNVAVPVKGGTVIGRVLRASGARPDTHVIIDPGGGEAHVEAEVSKVRLHTPETYASAAQQAAAAQAAQGGPPGAGGQGGGAAAVREGVGLLLEGFAPPAPRETPAQSQARGAKQVVAAQKSLASGWNASKHPRAAGGKFGYTTGGKRAKRASAASSRTLGVGSNGALVRSIQRQLHIPADGKYGPQTRAAVERYQRQHGLQVDGVVGAQTIAGLRGNPNAKSIAPGPITSRVARVHPASRTTRSARGRTVTTTTVTTSAARVPARASAKARARSRYGGGAIV